MEKKYKLKMEGQKCKLTDFYDTCPIQRAYTLSS